MSLVAQEPAFLAWLGAPAKYGLALPDADPTACHMYCPRGVWIDDEIIAVVDSGNHRILIWRREPGQMPQNHSDANLVIGQPDFQSEGPKLFHLPTGIIRVADMLLVADAWHHRILGFKDILSHCKKGSLDIEPSLCLGQPDMDSIDPNSGGEVAADSLYWPYGIAYVNQRLYVADTGNRRVLFWHGLPDGHRPADGVIGQDDFFSHEENRGAIDGRSFRWAHDMAGDENKLFIADAGNHRVLAWAEGYAMTGSQANLVLGQKAFDTSDEFPYSKQDATKMRFPYGICHSGNTLAVADTANNRVLLFDQLPDSGVAPAATRVIGQPDFEANGENNWKAVNETSLCWPYGLHLHGDLLAIADSGNNRVMLWRV